MPDTVLKNFTCVISFYLDNSLILRMGELELTVFIKLGHKQLFLTPEFSIYCSEY